MAKTIRMVTASEDIAGLIDRGAEVKTTLDNLTYEDKGIKIKIGGAAASALESGETSIKLEGKRAVAVVSQTEKMTVNAGAERFTELKVAINAGFLASVVEVKKSLMVPPDDISRAAEALKAAGITATVVESLSVKPDDVRAMRESEVSSAEEAQARKVLEECLESEVSYRVKYDNKG